MSFYPYNYTGRPYGSRSASSTPCSPEQTERYEADIHTHTVASGHGSSATITDMVKAAGARRLKLLGISDHGPATLGGGRLSYFRSLSRAPRERLGIRLLYGAEANIIDQNGTLDIPGDILKGLDFVIASMHRPILKSGTEDENTEAYINAMKNPYVTIIGHCSDSKFPADPFRLFRAAMDHRVLLEINNSSLSPDGYRGDTRFRDLVILNLSCHFQYPVLFASDSHGTRHIGDFAWAEQYARKAGVPAPLILNTSEDALLDFLASRTIPPKR